METPVPLQTEICYLGILANVDSSFLHLQMEGFEIQRISWDEMVYLVHALTRESEETLAFKLVHQLPCYSHNENSFFAISCKFSAFLTLNKYGSVSRFDDAFSQEAMRISDHLRLFIGRLRLFAEGNLEVPLQFCYFEHDGMPRRISSIESNQRSRSLYKVDLTLLPNLSRFLSETQIPLPDKNLELARQYYECSYEAIGQGMRFTTLMTGMEVLFNRGKDQISYTISRYTAVLLGQTAEDSSRIFKAMKKHYAARSSVVHAGQVDKITDDTVRELRGFLRESIKALYKLGLTKDGYCEKLDALGFGQPPTIIPLVSLQAQVDGPS